MKKLSWQDKTMIVAVLALVLLNPFMGQYIVLGIISGFEWVISQSDYIYVGVIVAVAISYFSKRRESTAKYHAGLKTKHQSLDGMKYVKTGRA